MKVNLLKLNSPLLSETLANIPDPPKELYYLGNAQIMQVPRVAIVGSRKLTPYGRAVTTQLATELARAGVAIISGLALGLDSVAHQAALDTGGLTLAVLPGGLDKIYPVSHTNLAKNILAKGGALVSEYPTGTTAQKYQFIARNRLIAGLCDVLVIPEAADKSGSLHTAEFALDQGKTIMAVPGNITSPYSAGPNNLIKTGALPITSAADIFQELGIQPDTKQKSLPQDSAQAKIIELIQEGVTDTEELLAKSNLEPRQFNQALTMLEISGAIKSAGAGHFSLP